MKCMNCGADNLDGVKFCENCGQPLVAQDAQPQQTYPQPYQQPQQPYPYNQPVNMVPDPYNGHPMKWYKFLVYFALIASAVLNLFNAIRSFTSGNYTVKGAGGKTITGQDAKDIMYAAAPGLKGADVFYGITLILSAALLVVAWYYLYKKKVQGPKYLYISYAFSAVISAIYSVWVYAVAKDALEDPTTVISTAVGSAILGVIMIAVNVVYFNKRKDIFIN